MQGAKPICSAITGMRLDLCCTMWIDGALRLRCLRHSFGLHDARACRRHMSKTRIAAVTPNRVHLCCAGPSRRGGCPPVPPPAEGGGDQRQVGLQEGGREGGACDKARKRCVWCGKCNVGRRAHTGAWKNDVGGHAQGPAAATAESMWEKRAGGLQRFSGRSSRLELRLWDQLPTRRAKEWLGSCCKCVGETDGGGDSSWWAETCV